MAAATLDTLRWQPKPGEEGRTVLAVLPWLGIPVLLAAAFAEVGRPLPGEVLPVVAFLPLAVLAAAAALRIPVGRRLPAVGLPGAVLLAALLAFLARDPGPGALATLTTALAATAACVALLWAVGRRLAGAAPLATLAAAAMAFSQGLDGWLTYLAVENPLGWLPQPPTERVPLSRLLLELAPGAYPLLKLGLAVGVTLGVARQSLPPASFLLLVLVVCYAGLSPAMYSAANLLAA